MSDYKCKCGNTTDFFIEHNLSQYGLYCGECGKWQKWLNKDEERLFNHKHSLAEHDKQIRADAIEECINFLKEKHYCFGKTNYVQAIEDLKFLKENKE